MTVEVARKFRKVHFHNNGMKTVPGDGNFISKRKSGCVSLHSLSMWEWVKEEEGGWKKKSQTLRM